MKKMDGADVYHYAKTLMPAGRDSKLLSLVYEIHSGDLVAEVLEGEPAAASSEDHVLAGVYACMMEGRAPSFLFKRFEVAAGEDDLIVTMAEKIESLEIKITVEEKGELSVSHPPHVAAAFVAAQDRFGRYSYLLYRHSDVDRERAILLVKATARAAAEQMHASTLEEREKN
ncbi:MAG: hypothetical protein QY323_06025 [Patescibacteria group bacterium]|nr:MAG: hypothetical protein QY323_06025 [Patescibacteria group bacterium]